MTLAGAGSTRKVGAVTDSYSPSDFRTDSAEHIVKAAEELNQTFLLAVTARPDSTSSTSKTLCNSTSH